MEAPAPSPPEAEALTLTETKFGFTYTARVSGKISDETYEKAYPFRTPLCGVGTVMTGLGFGLLFIIFPIGLLVWGWKTVIAAPVIIFGGGTIVFCGGFCIMLSRGSILKKNQQQNLDAYSAGTIHLPPASVLPSAPPAPSNFKGGADDAPPAYDDIVVEVKETKED